MVDYVEDAMDRAVKPAVRLVDLVNAAVIGKVEPVDELGRAREISPSVAAIVS
jgi:hypothetical protein